MKGILRYYTSFPSKACYVSEKPAAEFLVDFILAHFKDVCAIRSFSCTFSHWLAKKFKVYIPMYIYVGTQCG
jgi:hypothetical protein